MHKKEHALCLKTMRFKILHNIFSQHFVYKTWLLFFFYVLLRIAKFDVDLVIFLLIIIISTMEEGVRARGQTKYSIKFFIYSM